MPFPRGNARIGLGLSIAQVVLRSSYRSNGSVPDWSFANNHDFISVITLVCQTGRIVLSKLEAARQSEKRDEKRELNAFQQLDPVTAIIELVCLNMKAALPPIPTQVFNLIVELCTQRLTGRITISEGSGSELQQLLHEIDSRLINTLDSLRQQRVGRPGGTFWSILADQWIHEIKEKSRGGDSQMSAVSDFSQGSRHRILTFLISTGNAQAVDERCSLSDTSIGRKPRPHRSSHRHGKLRHHPKCDARRAHGWR